MSLIEHRDPTNAPSRADEPTLPAPRAATPSVRGLLLLAGIGAVVGGVVGTGVLAGLLSRGFREFQPVDAGLGAIFGGTLGVALGAIMPPLVGWFILRPVPLGRALAWTMVGSVVGVVAGWRIAPFNDTAVITGGVSGLVLGAVAARLATRWKQRGARSVRRAE